MIAWIKNNLKAVILTFLGLIQRAMCCFKKKKRDSSCEIPLNVDTILSNGDSFGKSQDDDSSWNDWDDGPCEVVVSGRKKNSSVSDQIQAYRQSIQRKKSEVEQPELEADLFADMSPVVKKQKKIYVGPDNREPIGSRLTMKPDAGDPLLTMGGELQDWGETQTGWSPEDEDLNDVLREQRRKPR